MPELKINLFTDNAKNKHSIVPQAMAWVPVIL